MSLLWATIIISICQCTSSVSRVDGSAVLCAFVDEMWMAQRREMAALASEQQKSSGIFSPDNMANKIQSNSGIYVDPGSYGEVLRDNKTIRCPDSKDFCYTLWEGDPNDKTKYSIIKQGCWDQSDRQTCSQPTCVPRAPVNRRHNNTHFCCCQGDMCNVNVTVDYPAHLEATQNPAATARYHIITDSNYRDKTIAIALASVFAVALVIAISYLLYRLRLGPGTPPYKPEHLIESPPPTPTFDLDQLKLCSLMSGGRYGDVWRGTLYDIEVAVKLFAPMQKQYFYNERDIYTLPHIEHPSLLKYFGSEENMKVDGMVPYSIIVMSYMPNGTLSQYLKEHVIDWNQTVAFMLSSACGLAHLHTDIFLGDKEKPAVAHRDLNSRNILIKEDLTCCICDYGFAIKILGSKFINGNGDEEIAEQSPISDVGTLRYMAPEVLDGAVNLRDCEASLKQIDVYALGLVMWETATRCSELYQGMPVPDYKLPFEVELGSHPSFEDMQRHVSWKRGRPVFPDVWKDTNPAMRALKETIEDSWDQDAEARLTALCVEERIMDMMALWENRNKVGITPTNPTTLMNSSLPEAVHNLTTEPQNPDTMDGPDRSSSVPNGSIANGQPHMVNVSDLPPGMRLPRGEISVSESTVETMLTASPTDPLPPPPPPPVELARKSNNLTYAQNNQPLQPHQGQNPTVERNTHKRSDDKLVVIGNTLMDKSAMEEGQENNERNLTGVTNPNNITDDLFEAIADNLESSLVQNDLLGNQQPRPQGSNALPTQSVQNHHYASGQNHHGINPSEPLIARPKMPNVPGNGAAHPLPNTSLHQPQPQPQKQKKFKLKKPKTDMFTGRMNGLYQFGKNLLRGGAHDGANDDSANYPTENLRNPAQFTAGVSQAAAGYQQEEQPGKSNLGPRHVPTEVCLRNGMPVVRPMSLGAAAKDAANYNVDQSTSSDDESDQETLPKYRATDEMRPDHRTASESQLGFAEVGIAKLENTHPNHNSPRGLRKVQLRSQSSVDLSPTSGTMMDLSGEDINGVRRPSSLSVNGHNYTKVGPRSVPSLNHVLPEEQSLLNHAPRAEGGACNASGSSDRLRYSNRDTSEGLLKARYSANAERMGDMNLGKRETTSVSPSNQGSSTINMAQFGGADPDHRIKHPADYPC